MPKLTAEERARILEQNKLNGDPKEAERKRQEEEAAFLESIAHLSPERQKAEIRIWKAWRYRQAVRNSHQYQRPDPRRNKRA